MKNLRAIFDNYPATTGVYRGYKIHIDGGDGQPVCKTALHTFREVRVKKWLQVQAAPTCVICIAREKKQTRIKNEIH